MSHTIRYQDPNFDKEAYRKRRSEGKPGTVPGLGAKNFGNYWRRELREARRKSLEKVKGGRHERKKRKSLKKSV